MKRRGSGILLHITSLPSPYGIGDVGSEAYRFVDFLQESRQSFWQILPINPTSKAYGNSPYSSDSAFAGDPLLISPDLLVEQGLLSKSDLQNIPPFPNPRVDYQMVTSFKKGLLLLAYERYITRLKKDPEFQRFVTENLDWLEDYALFKALKTHFKEIPWHQWPKEMRDREKNAITKCKEQFKHQILLEKFSQFVFFKQWLSLKRYINNKNIQIIGDIPIYLHHESADVWAHPEIFKLDDEKRPTAIGGVPPDYFSKTGQRWGNPVYNWQELKATNYRWWIHRLAHHLNLFNLVRLDHFRGLVAYWEIPADQPTAVNGRWVETPIEDFLKTLLKQFPCLPVIAEDLGIITPDVRQIMSQFEIPGMKVLLFAFGEDLPVHPYAPHNYIKDCVVFTGTHDSNTVKGWFRQEASPEERKRLFEYLGREVDEESIHWELIRLAMISVANTVIIPLQDILGLGEGARMNRPSTADGNWEWRFLPQQLTPLLVTRLSQMTELYGRG